MNKNTYVVIMAGGIGSRFWPFSRTNNPKQFHDVLGVGESMLQMTAKPLNRHLPAGEYLCGNQSRLSQPGKRTIAFPNPRPDLMRADRPQHGSGHCLCLLIKLRI